jgi:TonB-linked SusC/RagA family outer membrane protein
MNFYIQTSLCYDKKSKPWIKCTRKIIMRINLIAFFIALACFQVSASSFAQNITLKQKNAALTDALRVIEAQSGYYIFYNTPMLRDAAPVNVNLKNASLDQALKALLDGQLFTYAIIDRTVVIQRKERVLMDVLRDYFRAINIRGRVLDEGGQPLAGASVKIKGSNRVVMTNGEGLFELRGVDEKAIIVISFIGYEPKELRADSDLTNIKLILTSSKLEEVMVSTGYQTLPKERATGSFSVVPRETLKRRMETNLLDRIEGSVPGLFMKNGDINIRGVSTLYGNRTPLYVVDGFPYEGSTNYLINDDIADIYVLKDAAAASIYGSRAANGVIVITTKKGSPGKTRISYSNSFFITPLPDVSYFNFMNAKETVDLQQELFNLTHQDYSDYIKRSAQPKAIEALYLNKYEGLSDDQLNATLNKLRGLDNRSQLEGLLMQKQFKQQHNFSVSGGNEVHEFRLSANYTRNRGYNIGSNSNEINLNLNENVRISKWLTAGVNMTTYFSDNKFSPINALGYYRSAMPYEMLQDENGENLRWNYRKSSYEIERLIGLGLHDESFNPLNELDKFDGLGKSNYVRLNGNVNAKIIKGLSLDLKYQIEKGGNYSKSYYKKTAYTVKNMVNDATKMENGVAKLNVPNGGQIYEGRGDSRSYTARAQLNFDRQIAAKHHTTSLIGMEQRSVMGSSTNTHRMGYDDNNLRYVPVNAVDLAKIPGTESVNDEFSYDETQNNNFGAYEDRFVSVYANVGHTYNDRYNITASVRIDDSNLFGADPKYRHQPLWSVGASWQLSKESFMKNIRWLNNLSLRATYGLNGNVAQGVGPYLQATTIYNMEAEAMATLITNPPNKSLRWESTAVTNIGLDFSILNDRISGSIDLYGRKSTDLLGERETDPTNAFGTALVNYGSLYNRGIELGLNSTIIRNDNFSWNTNVSLSFNKNRMTEISTRYETVYGYTDGGGIEKVGYPMSSLFNFKWAGLDPTNGTVMVYDKDGNVVKNYDAQGGYVANMTDVNGLEYAGTLRPTYTIGFNNSFRYKQFSVAIQLIANGGNVMRDATPSILSKNNLSQNVDRRVMNFWRKAGDEKIPGVMPAPDLNNTGNSYFASLWYAANINTLKADYIKIRSINFTYDLTTALFKKRKDVNALLSFQVRDPYKWFRNDKGLDPEAYAQSSIYAERTMPVTPVYSLGASVNF